MCERGGFDVDANDHELSSEFNLTRIMLAVSSSHTISENYWITALSIVMAQPSRSRYVPYMPKVASHVSTEV